MTLYSYFLRVTELLLALLFTVLVIMAGFLPCRDLLCIVFT